MYDEGPAGYDPAPPPAQFQAHMRRTVEVAIDEALAPRPEADILDTMAAAPTGLVSDHKLLVEVLLWNALVFAADTLTLYACLRGLGVELTPAASLIAFILGSIVVTLGPIPFGLGTFEATSISLLHLLGAPIEGAFSAVFLLRFLTLWIPLVLGLLQLRRFGHLRMT